MGSTRPVLGMAAIVAAIGAAVGLSAQRPDAFSASREHPAIAYGAREGDNPVRRLNDALAAGRVHLDFDRDAGRGYLLSVLDALQIGVESQVLVFSETSNQAKYINPSHPRALYFNDRVAVGWVPGTDLLEFAAHDAQQGVNFYTLTQQPAAKPRLTRETSCLL
ncbi:MAG TPA: hypothetical protein VNG89_25825, partial [Vicinamibacterales bacterium]|nr:hypothetical protein [Vicinamibacterales bacterium]